MFENAYPHIAYKFILHITYPFLYLLFFMGKESMECTPRNTIVRDLICILFIGSSIETAVKLSGFTFQGYPLNLDVCK